MIFSLVQKYFEIVRIVSLILNSSFAASLLQAITFFIEWKQFLCDLWKNLNLQRIACFSKVVMYKKVFDRLQCCCHVLTFQQLDIDQEEITIPLNILEGPLSFLTYKLNNHISYWRHQMILFFILYQYHIMKVLRF